MIALGTCALGVRVSAQYRRLVIAASVVLDGKGGVRRDTRIVIERGTIVALDPKAEPVDHDLRGLTVLPGWIDAHVHLTWIFGRDGRNLNGGETTMDAAYRTAAKARADLMAGFTKVQSVGSRPQKLLPQLVLPLGTGRVRAGI